MKKTYWWKIIMIGSVGLFMVWAYFNPCEHRLSRCIGGEGMFIVRTMFHFSIPVLTSSLVLLFLSASVSKKWLKFAAGWIIFSMIIILLTPASIGGYVSVVPEREVVSFFINILFLIISLILITFWTIKEKRSQK
jgi:hypothetical protein